MKTYLCGPINGCTDAEAKNWREIVKSILGPENCIDPMRRDYRGIEEECVNEIVNLDKADIYDSDIVLVNAWNGPSWGTAMEIYAAAQMNKRVFIVVPRGTSVSPWLRFHGEIVHSLLEALAKIRELDNSAAKRHVSL